MGSAQQARQRASMYPPALSPRNTSTLRTHPCTMYPIFQALNMHLMQAPTQTASTQTNQFPTLFCTILLLRLHFSFAAMLGIAFLTTLPLRLILILPLFLPLLPPPASCPSPTPTLPLLQGATLLLVRCPARTPPACQPCGVNWSGRSAV